MRDDVSAIARSPSGGAPNDRRRRRVRERSDRHLKKRIREALRWLPAYSVTLILVLVITYLAIRE